eukprot:5047308-Pleurochrysis_carterae.AAC.1
MRSQVEELLEIYPKENSGPRCYNSKKLLPGRKLVYGRMRTLSLVRMLVVRVRKDLPSFTCVLVEKEKMCQSMMLLKNAAMMSFWLVLSKDDDFRLNLHVERRGTK